MPQRRIGGLKAIGLASTFSARQCNGKGRTDLRKGKKVATGASSSNLVAPYDVSAHMSLPGDPDEDGPRVRASTVAAAHRNLSTVADCIGKEQMQAAAGPQAVTLEDDELTKLETNIRLRQGAPGAWRLPHRAQLPAVLGWPSVEAPTTVRNSRSFEDAWVPTPSLHRPSDSFSNRTKFLIASATAALFVAGCFAFGSSDRSVEVEVAAYPTAAPLVELFPLGQAEAPSAVEDQVPEVQTASLPPTVRLDIQPTESGMEARPPQTRLPERRKQLFESGIDGRPPPMTLPQRANQLFMANRHDPTCFPSASAVRQNHPGGWPSWTLRAPGHEGTRCWYSATRTTANDHASEITPRKETAGATGKSGSPAVLFGVP
jgi:hypothetical protein